MDLTEMQRRWALGPAVDVVDGLRDRERLLEAEVRKLLGDVARAERERDEARGEVKAMKAAMEARFSWER